MEALQKHFARLGGLTVSDSISHRVSIHNTEVCDPGF